MIHIGKKAPKGFKELPRAIHLGRGIWMMRIEPVKVTQHAPLTQGGRDE